MKHFLIIHLSSVDLIDKPVQINELITAQPPPKKITFACSTCTLMSSVPKQSLFGRTVVP